MFCFSCGSSGASVSASAAAEASSASSGTSDVGVASTKQKTNKQQRDDHRQVQRVSASFNESVDRVRAGSIQVVPTSATSAVSVVTEQPQPLAISTTVATTTEQIVPLSPPGAIPDRLAPAPPLVDLVTSTTPSASSTHAFRLTPLSPRSDVVSVLPPLHPPIATAAAATAADSSIDLIQPISPRTSSKPQSPAPLAHASPLPSKMSIPTSPSSHPDTPKRVPGKLNISMFEHKDEPPAPLSPGHSDASRAISVSIKERLALLQQQQAQHHHGGDDASGAAAAGSGSNPGSGRKVGVLKLHENLTHGVPTPRSPTHGSTSVSGAGDAREHAPKMHPAAMNSALAQTLSRQLASVLASPKFTPADVRASTTASVASASTSSAPHATSSISAVGGAPTAASATAAAPAATAALAAAAAASSAQDAQEEDASAPIHHAQLNRAKIKRKHPAKREMKVVQQFKDLAQPMVNTLVGPITVVSLRPPEPEPALVEASDVIAQDGGSDDKKEDASAAAEDSANTIVAAAAAVAAAPLSTPTRTPGQTQTLSAALLATPVHGGTGPAPSPSSDVASLHPTSACGPSTMEPLALDGTATRDRQSSKSADSDSDDEEEEENKDAARPAAHGGSGGCFIHDDEDDGYASVKVEGEAVPPLTVAAALSEANVAVNASMTAEERAVFEAASDYFQPPTVELFDKRKSAEYEQLMCTGAIFLKHGRSGKPSRRRVVLNRDGALLEFTKESATGKVSARHQLPMKTVESLIAGKQTAVFKRSTASQTFDSRAITIKGAERELNLEALSAAQRDEWLAALHWLLSTLKA